MNLFSDSYRTLAASTEADLRERGSRFLAHAWPVNNQEEVKQHLAALKRQYPDATHHCYAYRIGMDETHYRVNDDGEPSNTAGRPILRAIQSAGLTNVLVVVVRYFGGKLLGVPGLIQSYGGAATLALQKGTIVEKELQSVYEIRFPSGAEHDAYRLLKLQQARVTAQETDENGNGIIRFAIRSGKAGQLMVATKEFHKLSLQYLHTE